MKYIVPVFLSVFFLFSCAPLGIGKPTGNHIPSLGEIGKSSSLLSGKDIQQVGRPSLSRPIALSIREIPFTKKKFKMYSDLKNAKGQKTAVSYIDSIPEKPRYVSLEISDRIALTVQLNADHNKEVIGYLSKDRDYKIVTEISAVGNSQIMEKLIAAEGIFLAVDRNGLLALEVVKANSRESIMLNELDVFDHELAGFCWGLDRYDGHRIETIALDGESCPHGTERKAYKLDRTKSYLKL